MIPPELLEGAKEYIRNTFKYAFTPTASVCPYYKKDHEFHETLVIMTIQYMIKEEKGNEPRTQ